MQIILHTDLIFGVALLKKSRKTLWTKECLITASLGREEHVTLCDPITEPLHIIFQRVTVENKYNYKSTQDWLAIFPTSKGLWQRAASELPNNQKEKQDNPICGRSEL